MSCGRNDCRKNKVWAKRLWAKRLVGETTGIPSKETQILWYLLELYTSYQESFPTSTFCSNNICKEINSSVEEFLEIGIQNQLSQLYKDPKFVKNLSYRFNHDYLNDENPGDIFSGAVYKELLKPGGFLGLDNSLNVSFSFFTDGVNPFKSSKKQNLWPIYLMINELPPDLRQSKEYVLLAGLWCSEKKPNMLTFAHPIIESVRDLKDNGVSVVSLTGKKLIYATLLLSTADLPAKAMIANMKQFNGKNGCSTCFDTGEGVGSRNLHRIWPNNPRMEYRTHKSVVKAAFEATKSGIPVEGIKGASVMMLFEEFDLVKGFVPDWMHGVCLGVVKKMLALWLNSDRSKEFFIGDKVAAIDKRLTSLKVPSLVSRKLRALSDRANWKATEYRAWLLHFSIPVLMGILNHTHLQHYSLLVSAMALLVGDNITQAELTEAESLLDLFCKEFAIFYGESQLIKSS